MEYSKYVKVFSSIPKVKVIYTHIDKGYNFFYYEPDKYDIIISNPPFSCKDDILKDSFFVFVPLDSRMK